MISKTIVFAVSGVGAVQLKMDTDHVSIDIADESDGVIEVPRQADTTQNQKRDGTKDVPVKVINNNEKEKPSFCKCALASLAMLFLCSPFLYLIYSQEMINHFGDDCASMKKYKAFWLANAFIGEHCCVDGVTVPYNSGPDCPGESCHINGTDVPCDEEYYNYLNGLHNVTGLD